MSFSKQFMHIHRGSSVLTDLMSASMYVWKECEGTESESHPVSAHLCAFTKDLLVLGCGSGLFDCGIIFFKTYFFNKFETFEEKQLINYHNMMNAAYNNIA